jgi:hypothetical protein
MCVWQFTSVNHQLTSHPSIYLQKTDQSLLAQFFYADEDLNTVAAELDSFDGRKDPDRCTALVNHLRQCQDKVWRCATTCGWIILLQKITLSCVPLPALCSLVRVVASANHASSQFGLRRSNQIGWIIRLHLPINFNPLFPTLTVQFPNETWKFTLLNETTRAAHSHMHTQLTRFCLSSSCCVIT